MLEVLHLTKRYLRIVPGKANLKASWPVYVSAYVLYVSLFSALELWILEQPERFGVFLAAAAATKLGFEICRRRVAGELSLQYDERPAPVVQTLDLLQ